MKFKIAFFIFFVLLLQIMEAKENRDQSFLIRGKVRNKKQKEWIFAITGFFRTRTITVPVQSDGSFSQKVLVDGMQDIYLYLNNDAITFYVEPRDTIELNWDDHDFERTFEIKSLRKNRYQYRNNDLQLNWKLYKAFRETDLSLPKKLNEGRDNENSVRFKWINDLYNQELKTILSDTCTFSNTTEKFVYQVYYKYSSLLLNDGLLSSFSLLTNPTVVNPHNSSLANLFMISPIQYRVEYDKAFYECPEYRNFLFDCIRFPNKVITSYIVTERYTSESEVAPFSPASDAYYRGIVGLKIIPIRDWYATKSILFSFEYYSFKESEEVYNDFLPKCKTQKYKDTLTSFYASIKRFKPGNMAPDFKLVGEEGKFISLSDFKGKVVYIDFWGIGCAPCINDIKNDIPKLHELYNGKDVVFINICVDANENSWKKFLAKTKLDGVNLLAEGWTENKVCKLYNIYAVPHYILIDKQGRIFEANAKRPGELMIKGTNDIDKILNER